jgi:transcription elongation factor Elf1
MKEFTKKQTLTCIYCGEKQDQASNLKAIDFISPVLNLFGPIDKKNTKYQHSVEQIQCGDCDQFFYIRLNEEDKIIAANLPGKLY